MTGINSALFKGLLGLVGLAAALEGAAAAEFEDVSIHGFGGWAVGNSDPYPYLSGTGAGDNEYENVEFALAVSARPAERFDLYAQLLFESTPEGDTADVELLAAVWELTGSSSIRFGRSKMPFGIYTEFFHVGTLRPFFHLPQSIYGPTGFVTDGYDGIGLAGNIDGARWGLSWDVYFGGVVVEIAEPFEPLLEGEEGQHEGEGEEGEEGEEGHAEEEESTEDRIRDVLGGRLVVRTPVDGLSFGVSAYAGEPEGHHEPGQEAPNLDWGDHFSYGAQLEYLSGGWSLRAEAGRNEEAEADIDSAYVEMGYYLNDRWQLAGRVETVEFKLKHADRLPPAARSLTEHDEWALGVNYWFNDNLVLKLAYHDIDGNVFAVPPRPELGEVLEHGALDGSTQLVNLGVQLSF